MCVSGRSSYGFFEACLAIRFILCVYAEPVGGENNTDSGPESSGHLTLV